MNVFDQSAVEFGSVCSGIEAASVAWHELGWRAAWLAEIDKFASAVLAHHYPTVPNLGDMTKIARAILVGVVKAPDVFCGGTPCQAFSVAGLRNSLDDARGNLTLTFVEIANAIDHVRTGRGEDECVIVWENVPGVLSTKDNAFGCFLGGLAGEDGPLEPPGGKWANAGAVYGPRRAVAWRTLDAQYFGVAQRRRRVLVVASAREGFDPSTVLFEWDGLRRDTAPSRQAGQAAAGSLTASTGGSRHNSHWNGGAHPPLSQGSQTRGGGIGASNQEIFEQGGAGLVAGTLQAGGKAAGSATQQDAESGLLAPVAYGGNNQSGPIDVATARNACASASGRMDFETETFLVQPAHTPRGEGFDASEDGTGRGTPLVPVAFVQNSRDEVRLMGGDGSIVGALAAETGAKQQCYVATPAIAFNWQGGGTETTLGYDPESGVSGSLSVGQTPAVAVQASQSGVRINDTIGTLDANYGSRRHNGVMQGMQVRRLTPTECERLQGFPDGYTDIPVRPVPAKGQQKARELALAGDARFKEIDGVMHVMSADGPRYKALGNSWAVPKFTWLGRRIDRALRRAA